MRKRVIIALLAASLFMIDRSGRGESPPLTGPAATANCGQCHGWRPANRERRPLNQPHQSITLAHASLWCLDCHDPEGPEALLVLSLGKIPFTDSHRLCALCHGRQTLAWTFGGHGKQMGSWRSEQRTLSRCTACHDPHQPAFKSVTPHPPPPFPRNGHGPQRTYP